MKAKIFTKLRGGRTLKSILLALLLGVAGMTNAQSFIVGDLEYGIIENTNNVIVYGHKDGNMASGGIDIPETVTYEGNTYTVTKIAPHAFEGCINLSSELVIPNTVTTICDEAFKGLRFVGPLTLGNSVESIGDFCFEGCHSISFYNNIPNSLKHIGVWAFFDTGWWNGQPDEILYKDGVCFGYKETKPTGTLVVAEGTRLIVKDAFGACGSLVSLVLPSSLEYINELAFYNCTGLTSIKSLASVPPEAIQSFEGVDKSIPVEVPVGSLSAYQNAEGWNEFTNIYEESASNTYDFEDGTLQGWTTIDADGDGFNWELTTSGAHGGSHAVMSKSWDTNAGALTPDNFLVSPSKLQYSQISLWALGVHPSWSAEHFGVAVSTAGNSDPSDFTTIAEWTATNEYTEYTADLSAYSGQDIWVAIRHFDCTDQYALNVDDITLTVNDAPAGIPITEIYVNGFTAPAWGSHPDFDVVLSADAHCAVTNVIWVHGGATMEPNEVFDDEDNRYFMRLEFLAEDGYTFDPEATVYFNGDASIHDAGWNSLSGSGLLWAYTIDFYLTAPAPGTYVLTVLCDPTMGTVTGSGTYAEGSSVTIEAIPLDGYIFDHWNDNSTENPRTVIIESNKTFEAFFKQNGVNEYGLNALSVYPNPANETIRINGLETDATIEIYNSLGAKVRTMNVTADGEINIGDMAPGIYMLRCGKQTVRFVKE